MSVLPVAPVPSSIAEGRYDVHELIGRGSTARVHRGHDLLLHRDVAVKLVPISDADAAERWWAREVGLRARLEPGQVPGLFDCGRADDDTAFVVLQLALGGTLTDRLRPGPLGLDDTVGLTCTLAGSLGRMHARGVRHGDVSVDAVLSDGRGAPLWCGFAPVPSPGPVGDDAEGLARLALSCLSGTGSAEGVDALRGVLDDVVHRGGCAVDHADRLRDALLVATRGSGASRRRPSPFPAGSLRHGGERVRSGSGHRRGVMAAASLATVAAVGLGIVGLAETASSQPLEAAAATLAPAPVTPVVVGATSEQRVALPTSGSARSEGSASASVTRVVARAGSRYEDGVTLDARSSRATAQDASSAAASSDGAPSDGTRDDKDSSHQGTSRQTSSEHHSSPQTSSHGSSPQAPSQPDGRSHQDPSDGSDDRGSSDGSDDAHGSGSSAAGRAPAAGGDAATGSADAGDHGSSGHGDQHGHGGSGAVPAVRSEAHALTGQTV